MKARFETTEEEDEKAKMRIDDALQQAFHAGRAAAKGLPFNMTYTDELWEKLLQILGIGEWEDDVSTSDPLLRA